MNCPECGLNLGLVGRNHLCRPVVSSPRDTNSVVSSKPEKVRHNAVPHTSVPHEDVPHVPHTDVERVRRWREKNPERHREYHRAYMARRRASLAGE